MSKTIFDRILTADYHDYHMCIYFYASIGIVDYVIPELKEGYKHLQKL